VPRSPDASAKAGRTVIIGSRDPAKAAAAAATLGSELGRVLEGSGNAEASAQGDIVIVAVPFASQEATLKKSRRTSRARSSSTPPCP
jgi:predicted dinucleotide-binding enzyme